MKRLAFFMVLLLAFVLVATQCDAQGCSMCTKTASQLGDKAAKGLNRGILYLAFLPLGLLVSIFLMWRRGQKRV